MRKSDNILINKEFIKNFKFISTFLGDLPRIPLLLDDFSIGYLYP